MNGIFRVSSTARLGLALALSLGVTNSVALRADCEMEFDLENLFVEALDVQLDQDSSKFNEYRDLTDGFRLPSLTLHGYDAKTERFLDLRIVNGGRNDARYAFGYGVEGRYRLDIDHNLIPHNFGNNGTLLWRRTADGVYSIDNSIQTALQTALTARFAARQPINYAYLNTLLAPYLATASKVDVGLQRDRSRVNLELGSIGDTRLGFEYRHERRVGTRAYAATFGFGNVNELPEPIDYDTSDFEVKAEWGGESWGLTSGVRHSRFRNGIDTLYWDNPFRITDSTDANAYSAPTTTTVNGASLGVVDLAPDNRASSLFLNGRGKVGAWWLSGAVNYSQMRQNDRLLPYTQNTSIRGINHVTGALFNATDASFLPAQTADREVDTLTINGSAGTSFGDDWSLTLRYAFYDYENNGERLEFDGYVRYHAVWEDIPRITVPYAYQKQDLSAELAWDLNDANRLALSYKLRQWDRDFRETEKSDEDVVKLSFDSQPNRHWSLRASYEVADRTIDGYDVAAQEYSFLDPEGPNNLPGLRKYAQAAREYDDYTAQLLWMPIDAVQVSVGLSSRDDQYDESEFGLIDDEIFQWNAEIGYTPGENFTAYIFGHEADRQSFQKGRQSGATPSTNPRDDWSLTLDELTTTYGLGLEAKPTSKISIEVSANWSESDGEADFTTPSPSNLPVTKDIDNYEDIELFSARAEVDFQVTKALTVGLFYLYEDFTLDRFILQGLKAYLPGALLLNANEGTYQGDVIALRIGYTF